MSAEPETTMANEPATMLFLHIPQSPTRIKAPSDWFFHHFSIGVSVHYITSATIRLAIDMCFFFPYAIHRFVYLVFDGRGRWGRPTHLYRSIKTITLKKKCPLAIFPFCNVGICTNNETTHRARCHYRFLFCFFLLV